MKQEYEEKFLALLRQLSDEDKQVVANVIKNEIQTKEGR